MTNCHSCVDFVESIGVLWEADGLPRIAGRIFGYLIVQPEPSSLDELAVGLGVSKASISTDARRLEQLGLITRISLPGDRRDYYTIDADAPATGLEMRLRNLRRFDRTLSEAGDRERLPPVVRERLARFEYAHHRIVAALEGVLEELKQQHPATLPADGSSQQ
jgi:predicted transcriptional regulator